MTPHIVIGHQKVSSLELALYQYLNMTGLNPKHIFSMFAAVPTRAWINLDRYLPRFTTEGELPVIQSAHNEELAALKLKMKKVGKKL